MACTRIYIPNSAQSTIAASTASPFSRVQVGVVGPAATITPTTDGLFVLPTYPTTAEAHLQLRKWAPRVSGSRRRSRPTRCSLSFFLGSNTANGGWTEIDRNLFRQELAKTDPPNLMHRFGEIVSLLTAVDAGSGSRTILSFERGLMPLLAYLIFDCVLKSPAKKEVNALYSIIPNNFDEFAGTVSAGLNAYLARGSAETPQPPTVFVNALRTTTFRLHLLYQVLETLASLFDEFLGRWRDAVVHVPQVPALVDKVKLTFRFWSAAITASRRRPADVDRAGSDSSRRARSSCHDLLRPERPR